MIGHRVDVISINGFTKRGILKKMTNAGVYIWIEGLPEQGGKTYFIPMHRIEEIIDKGRF